MTLVLTASAACLRCGWAADGDPEAVDKQAERHTRREQHPTVVEARPQPATVRS